MFGLGLGLGFPQGGASLGGASSPVIPGLLSAQRGIFNLFGNAAALVYAPAGAYIMPASVGTFNFTGIDLTPVIDHLLVADTTAFSLAGSAATLLYNRAIAAAAATFALSGNAATLIDTLPSSYAGPGDVFASAWAWYSPARAYSAAFAAGGTAVMDLVDQAGANAVTINILSTGFVDVASLNTWVAAHSVTTIKVAKLYDQTGNGRHVVQATLAVMPGLALSAINGLPAVDFTVGTNSVLQTSSTFTIAQPVTYSAVQKRTSGTALGGSIGAQNGANYVGSGSGANLAAMSAGTIVTTAATDNSWYALQALINSSSSAINVNGSDTTGLNTNTQSWSATAMRLGRAGSNQFLGQFAEGGMWTSTSTSTDRGNVYTTQHGSSGYSGAV